MSEQTELVTPREALEKVVGFINKPGILDLNVFIELLTWERKLLLWVLKESKEMGTLNELLPELSVELREALRIRQEKQTEGALNDTTKTHRAC